MATEILSIPEENLKEVCLVILAGLGEMDQNQISLETTEQLSKWAVGHLVYMGELGGNELQEMIDKSILELWREKLPWLSDKLYKTDDYS